MKALVFQAGRFAVVGGIAFLVDAAALWLLMGQGIDPYLARALAFLPAFAANFLLNRQWTFAHEGAAWHHGLLRYFAVQLGGMAVNYASYAAVLTLIGVGRMNAMLALFVGSGVAMVFNFVGARWFAFRASA